MWADGLLFAENLQVRDGCYLRLCSQTLNLAQKQTFVSPHSTREGGAVETGTICGLLGPNGAGKSTTMDIMTGCLAATSGEVHYDGLEIYANMREVKRAIGYLPEIPPLYPELTVEPGQEAGTARAILTTTGSGPNASTDLRPAVPHALLEHGVTLLELSARKASLEDVFIELAEGDSGDEKEAPAC